MAILDAIGTDESKATATDLAHPPRFAATPHWHVLPAAEREALRRAESALEKLERYSSGPEFRRTLTHYVGELHGQLTAGISYLSLIDHKLTFIGPVGAGKSTAINALFGLTLPPGKGKEAGRRAVAKLASGLLPTGSGRSTAFEYRIAYGPQTRILIEPEDEVRVQRDVRGLCEYWLAEVRGKMRVPRPFSEELERVYRNMADLAEREEEDDPLKALITPDIETPDDLFSVVLAKMNLQSRKRTELVRDPGLDRDAGHAEVDWVRRRLRQINLGRLSDCPLPKRVTLVLKNRRLKSGGLKLTVVDTRGIDEQASREDLAEAERDPYSLCILCTPFKEAPAPRILSEIERAKDRRFGTVEGKRFVVLVLPQRDEATRLADNEDDEPISESEGYRRRGRQVERALGPNAQHVPALFFNSESESAVADAVLGGLLERVSAMREVARGDLERACDSVGMLIAERERVQLEQCQRQVREKLERWLKKYRALEDPMQQSVHRGMLDEVARCHPSSIYSATRYAGVGRTVSIYHIFNMIVRERANALASEPVGRLKALLEDLRDDWDIKRPDMRQPRIFLADLAATVDRKLTEFVERAESAGTTHFRPHFEQEGALWKECLDQYGHGPGYRERVSTVIERWFTANKDVVKRIEREVQRAWDGVFLGWVRDVVGHD